MSDVAPESDVLPLAAAHQEELVAGDDQPLAALNAYERAGVVVNGKPSLTVDEAAAQLDRANLSWSPNLGEAATVTYAFRGSADPSLPSTVSGFQPFNATQITAAELSLRAWSDVANINFVRVGSGVSGPQAYSSNATIVFSGYTSGEDNAAAFTYLPGNAAAGSLSGDVFINLSLDYNASPVSGEYGQQVLTHEIGHAIGLSHPSDYDAGDTDPDNITYANNASYYEDSRQYSIMSYFGSFNTGASASIFAAAPQLDDIAAAQRMYGANYSTRAGDTVYGFGGNTGEPWYDLVGSNAHIYAAIWDGGGVDTLNFSGFGQNQLIDLREGDFSNVGGDIGNVAIAVGAKIENAIGGGGADVLIGNALNNLLQGQGGDDTFVASGGADTLDGGAGVDTVQFAGLAHSYAVAAGAQGALTSVAGGPEGGSDALVSIEALAFAEGTLTVDPHSYAAEVERLYGALGRAADPGGLESFEQTLFHGGSLTSIAQGIINSPEFASRLAPGASDSQFVTYLYETLLHREPESGGVAGYLRLMAAGASRADVLVDISESAEHVQQTSALVGAGLWQADERVDGVVLLYEAAFDRLPDAGGEASFVGQLAAGSSLQGVADILVASPEFQAHYGAGISDKQFVDELYALALHRAADSGGEAGFLGQLAAGVSRGEVLLEFAGSAEHQAALFQHPDYGLLAG